MHESPLPPLPPVPSLPPSPQPPPNPETNANNSPPIPFNTNWAMSRPKTIPCGGSTGVPLTPVGVRSTPRGARARRDPGRPAPPDARPRSRLSQLTIPPPCPLPARPRAPAPTPAAEATRPRRSVRAASLEAAAGGPGGPVSFRAAGPVVAAGVLLPPPRAPLLLLRAQSRGSIRIITHGPEGWSVERVDAFCESPQATERARK